MRDFISPIKFQHDRLGLCETTRIYPEFSKVTFHTLEGEDAGRAFQCSRGEFERKYVPLKMTPKRVVSTDLLERSYDEMTEAWLEQE